MRFHMILYFCVMLLTQCQLAGLHAIARIWIFVSQLTSDRH